MKIEFSSQRRETVLFLTTNMAAVTSRANQQFMFLSFSLFHLEGYRIRLNDQPVSGMPSYFESQ